MKRILLRCAIDCWHEVRATGRRPKLKARSGFRVSRWLAIRPATKTDGFRGWAVIHIKTGFAAATGIDSKARAVECAQKMTAARGSAWNFTDINTVRGWEDCKVIRVEYADAFSKEKDR